MIEKLLNWRGKEEVDLDVKFIINLGFRNCLVLD